MTLSAQGKIAAFHRKDNEERQERQRLEAQAAQEAEAARQQAIADSERKELELRHDARELLDEYEGLSVEERALFDERTDIAGNMHRLSKQATEKVIEQFNADNEKLLQWEFTQWRNANAGKTSSTQRSNVYKEFKARADERAAIFNNQLRDLELQSEKFADPVQRIIRKVPPDALALMLQLAGQEPTASQHIQAVKQENARAINEAKQTQLYQAFVEEVNRRGARGNATHINNIRQEFTLKGWDGIAR